MTDSLNTPKGIHTMHAYMGEINWECYLLIRWHF